jgi:hypothetical protein
MRDGKGEYWSLFLALQARLERRDLWRQMDEREAG